MQVYNTYPNFAQKKKYAQCYIKLLSTQPLGIFQTTISESIAIVNNVGLNFEK